MDTYFVPNDLQGDSDELPKEFETALRSRPLLHTADLQMLEGERFQNYWRAWYRLDDHRVIRVDGSEYRHEGCCYTVIPTDVAQAEMDKRLEEHYEILAGD